MNVKLILHSTDFNYDLNTDELISVAAGFQCDIRYDGLNLSVMSGTIQLTKEESETYNPLNLKQLVADKIIKSLEPIAKPVVDN